MVARGGGRRLHQESRGTVRSCAPPSAPSPPRSDLHDNVIFPGALLSMRRAATTTSSNKHGEGHPDLCLAAMAHGGQRTSFPAPAGEKPHSCDFSQGSSQELLLTGLDPFNSMHPLKHEILLVKAARCESGS